MKYTLVSFKTCPFAQRAAIALEEKGLDYELVVIDRDEKPDWFMAISPMGKVPVLQVTGECESAPVTLFESSVIVDYLEDIVPYPALHLADPLARATQRGWVETIAAILGDNYQIVTATTTENMRKYRDAMCEKLARIARLLSEGPYAAGERFTYLDAAFAPVLSIVEITDELKGCRIMHDLPQLARWNEQLSARPSVRRVITVESRRALREWFSTL